MQRTWAAERDNRCWSIPAESNATQMSSKLSEPDNEVSFPHPADGDNHCMLF
jgi:hypothetical protein